MSDASRSRPDDHPFAIGTASLFEVEPASESPKPEAAAELAAQRALKRRGLSGNLVRSEDGSLRVEGNDSVRIGIAIGKCRAIAAGGEVQRVGVGFCDLKDADRIRVLTPAFINRERHLCWDSWSTAACWAAKEAGLRALGLQLAALEQEESRVTVLAVQPARYDVPGLRLCFVDLPEGPLALAWQ